MSVVNNEPKLSELQRALYGRGNADADINVAKHVGDPDVNDAIRQKVFIIAVNYGWFETIQALFGVKGFSVDITLLNDILGLERKKLEKKVDFIVRDDILNFLKQKQSAPR